MQCLFELRMSFKRSGIALFCTMQSANIVKTRTQGKRSGGLALKCSFISIFSSGFVHTCN